MKFSWAPLVQCSTEHLVFIAESGRGKKRLSRLSVCSYHLLSMSSINWGIKSTLPFSTAKVPFKLYLTSYSLLYIYILYIDGYQPQSHTPARACACVVIIYLDLILLTVAKNVVLQCKSASGPCFLYSNKLWLFLNIITIATKSALLLWTTSLQFIVHTFSVPYNVPHASLWLYSKKNNNNKNSMAQI